jgi:ferric-dicitrate binding protein FerR (iron transport regulator)
MNLITKDIIYKYLAGEATVIQKRQLEEWLLSPENQETFYECLEEWERRHPQFIPDADKAFLNYRKRLYSKEDTTGLPYPLLYDTGGQKEEKKEEEELYSIATNATSSSNRGWFMKIAVLLLIILGAAVYKDKLLYRHYITGEKEIRTVLLPDNSKVTLLGNADLKLARLFNWKKERAVWLKGQAIFNIRSTPDHRPFFVNTPFKAQIQVLGTEFDLYAANDSTRVFLNEGSIRVNMDSSFSRPFIMKPGDLVKMGNRNMVQIKNNQFYWQFRTQVSHTLVFDKTPLSDVGLIMKEQFGKTIHIPDTALANRRISGSYKWTTEKDILNTLALMMNFTVTYEENGEAVLR